MKAFALGILSAALVVAVPMVQGQDSKIDAGKLQGKWKLVGLEADGKKVLDEKTKKIQFIFAGDKVTFGEELRYRLDPKAKPKAMDLFVDDEKTSNEAIYELAGDNLKLCFSQRAGLGRPKSFDTTGTKFMTFILERQK